MKTSLPLGFRSALLVATAACAFPTVAISEPPVVPMAAWKAAYFTPSQIEAGLAGDLIVPAAGATNNLLKYAYGLTPFDDASNFVPRVALVGNNLTLQYRRLSAATDLSYEIEASTDLKTWTSGAGTIEELTRLNLSEGIDLVTVRDLQPVEAACQRFLRLRVSRTTLDTGGSGLSDDWQIRYFGQLGVDPNGDPDGDGTDNKSEYLAGSNPNDPFDGQDLVVKVLLTPARQLLPGGVLRLWVGRSDGKPLRNAAVTFTSDDYFNSLVDGDQTVREITVRTDSNGNAYVRLSGAGGC